MLEDWSQTLNPDSQKLGAHVRRSREVLDFELPFLGKFLLLAAFVASRNPPATDRHLFQPRAAKRRRRGALSHDRQVPPLLSCHLLGPRA